MGGYTGLDDNDSVVCRIVWRFLLGAVLGAAFLAGTKCNAQLFSPYNLHAFPGTVVMPARYQYRPALVIAWAPQPVVSAFKLEPFGSQLNVTLRELLLVHPPTWNGTCAIGFTNVGTRLIGSFGFKEVYPWQGPQVQIFRGLNVPLYAPDAFRVEHGNFWGRCPNHSAPMLAAMLVEVR